jgi:hypothetical protein
MSRGFNNLRISHSQFSRITKHRNEMGTGGKAIGHAVSIDFGVFYSSITAEGSTN